MSDFRVEPVTSFHGHMCMGLALGIRAARLGLESVRTDGSGGLVVVSETRTCAVDAVQYLTGCSLGRGTLLVDDQGKNAFTFFPPDAAAVRVAVRKLPAGASDPGYRELFSRVLAGQAGRPDLEQFAGRQRELSAIVLDAPTDELFAVREVTDSPPERPLVTPSVPCEGCGEPTMEHRLVMRRAQRRCPGCLNAPAPASVSVPSAVSGGCICSSLGSPM